MIYNQLEKEKNYEKIIKYLKYYNYYIKNKLMLYYV